MTVTDAISNVGTITDNWTISIGHECSENVLTLETPTQSVPTAYVIPKTGDGTAEKLSISGHTYGTTGTTIKKTVAACAIKCQLEIYNQITNVWEVHSSSVNGGTVTPAYVANYNNPTTTCSFDVLVAAANGGTYSPVTRAPDIIYFRYAIFDENADNGVENIAKIYDPFEVTMNWECTSDTVTVS